MPLRIELSQDRSISVFRVSGSIYSQDGVVQLRDALSQRIEAGQYDLLVNVAAVSGMDESGVQTFKDMQADAVGRGGNLRIVGAPYGFLAAMALYDSARLFPYYPDSEEAIESFADGSEGGTKGVKEVKHFDILQFVKEQEKEEQEQPTATQQAGEGNPE